MRHACPEGKTLLGTDKSDGDGTMQAMSFSSPRDILAANLRRIIKAAAVNGEEPSPRAWALGKGLNVRLISRLLNGDNSVTLDKLAEVADACGLKPWHLLIEDLDPAKPPKVELSEEDQLLLERLRRIVDR